MKTKDIKIFLFILGIVQLFTCFLIFGWLFTSAYFDPNFSVTFNINRYNEANIEMFFLLFCSPLSFWVFFKTIDMWYKEYLNEKESNKLTSIATNLKGIIGKTTTEEK